jgi:uncharacterized protein YjiS (DUF1127 family)
MAIFEASRPVPFTSIAAFRVVQFVERQLEALRTWIEARQTERVLNSLSDHELNDIGLVRGEIETVSRLMAMR